MTTLAADWDRRHIKRLARDAEREERIDDRSQDRNA
jgi:hypothetical protein